MVKKYDAEAELKKIGKKLRAEQKKSTDQFIKDMDKGDKEKKK